MFESHINQIIANENADFPNFFLFLAQTPEF